jgi:sarcosine oxidase
VVFIGAGHAYKFAALLGAILADLALVGETPHRIAEFRLDRPALTDPAFVSAYHV